MAGGYRTSGAGNPIEGAGASAMTGVARTLGTGPAMLARMKPKRRPLAARSEAAMRNLATTLLTVTIVSAAAASPGHPRPYLRQGPANAGIVMLDCTVHVRDHKARRAPLHGITGGKIPGHGDYLGDARLVAVGGGGTLVKADRFGDALIFRDLTPGWYRLVGVQADVSTVVPPEALSRHPGQIYIYSYPFNPQDEPDALTFKLTAGQIVYLGRLRVEEGDPPKVDKDGSIVEWQRQNHLFRLERNRRGELRNLRGLLKAAKASPWESVVRARMEALQGGAPVDSSVTEWS